ncbi:MAG: hypothetical protein RLY40_664 [Pseudomonadota bacterium]|jgi:hypothetical protein
MRRFFYLCFLLSNLALDKIKKKLINFDNERLAIAFISIIGLGLLFPLVVIAPGLFESEWFLNLLTIPSEYGSFVAYAAYLGRLWNLLTAQSYANGKKTKLRNFLNQEIIINRQIGYAEKLFTPIGMLLGVSLGIFCLCLHAVIPFWEAFSYFAYILFVLAYTCAVGGLFNRLASSLDGARLQQEKIAIFVGLILGLLVALSLFSVLILTGTVPFVVVIGISKPFVDLLLLHKFLFALPFVLSLTSLTTSCFDYIAKAYCFFKYLRNTDDVEINERIRSRYYEYQTAFLGIIFGCLLALGITVGLFLTGGLVAGPIAITATIFATIVICNNVLAALFSRLGRLIDGIISLSMSQEEDYKTEFNVNSECCLALVRNVLSTSLPLSIDYSAQNRDLNDNKIKFELKCAQNNPAFFHFNNSEDRFNADNQLVSDNNLSEIESKRLFA